MTPEEFLDYILSLPEEARIQTIDSMREAMDSGGMSDETYGLMAELLSGVNAVSAFPEAQGEQRTDADFFDYIMQIANNFGAGPNAVVGRKPGDEGFDPHLSMAEALAQEGMPWGLAGIVGTAYDFLEPGLGEWGRAATAIGSAALPVARRVLSGIDPKVFRSLGRDSVSEYAAALDRMPPDRRAFLTPYSLEQLQEMVDEGYKVRISDSGAGYILSPEGDLQGVINAGNVKGAGRYAVEDAIKEGAVTLDAFDGFLPEYYSQFGFEETSRLKFDRQYAPPGWNYDVLGEPDVVFMRLRGR